MNTGFRQKLNFFFTRQSIRTRLIIWFLLIALIPLGWTTIISYVMCKKILFDQAKFHLKNIILRQENVFNFYFQERKLDARAFIRNHAALNAVAALDEALTRYGKDSPEYQATRKQFYSMLAYHARSLNYKNLWLVTKSGKIVFSVLPLPDIGENLLTSDQYKGLAKIFEKSRASLNIEMISTLIRQKKNSFTAYLSTPLLDSQNQLVGMVILELDLSSLYHYLASFRKKGHLVEMLLVAEVDGKPFEINPLRAKTQLEYPVDPLSPFGKLILRVLSQEEMIEGEIDYDHHKTLMVGKRLTNAMNWALFSKVNEDDLLAPIYRLQYIFWILGTLTAFTVTLVASSVARKIASPILDLTEKTKILASGDLSQRIKVTSEDEIGRLGQSFNEMATQLNHIITHLDELVAKRTKEYEIQNIKLEQTIKELQATRNQLIVQEKLASLGALTAGIAHEIKNPLNFINNFAELSLQLQQDLEKQLALIKTTLPENLHQELSEIAKTLKLNLGKIYEHGKRADSIVHNMLQHSRGMPGEKSTVDIHKLLDEYIDLSYHGMRARDSSFNVKIEKHYDLSIPPITILPQEISRVFLNLLNNAYYSVHQKQKSKDSSYQPTVSITTENHRDSLVIKFWDNGLGISPETLPKLFTPFFTTKPTGEGTGLGLSLSYNIVVQGHGGTLKADSQLGEFAEFILSLPYSQAS